MSSNVGQMYKPKQEKGGWFPFKTMNGTIKHVGHLVNRDINLKAILLKAQQIRHTFSLASLLDPIYIFN